MFLGTANTSKGYVRLSQELRGHSLRSGKPTTYIFLHSFGFVTCAGMNGY